MTATGKLAAFALAVAAAFGLGFGVGDAVGPFDDGDEGTDHVEAPAVHDDHGWGSDDESDR